MAQQIICLEKNKADFSYDSVVVTASQGQVTASYVQDRSNSTAWVTTGSVDADNTTLEVDFGDLQEIDKIILVQHNFKAYTLKYWNGSTYVDFSTPINVSGNATETKSHSFTAVETTKLLLTITGTMVVNSDKYLYQFIATQVIGQFNGWPILQDAMISKNKRVSKMLSGKTDIANNLGGFSIRARIKVTNDATDRALVESLFNSSEGFLFWPCGGDESQFSYANQGYRLEDIFLMRCQNDFSVEFRDGIYVLGIEIDMKLIEVTD
jgi:hypothetical protein